MQTKTKFYWVSLLLFLMLCSYWIAKVWELIAIELAGGEENYLGNFMLYLISWILVFLIFNLLIWLNFKFLFLKWQASQISGFIFWSVELCLLALIFEIFQWSSHYEPEIMKENFIIILVITLYSVAFNWFLNILNFKRTQAKWIQEKDKAELKLLQSQLNPHFLFNALNTCYYSAIDEDSPLTAQQILQLSGLMRFSLEKSSLDFISMEEEIGFLENYVRLQKDRFNHFAKDGIKIKLNWDEEAVNISPMLIQPFFENAFKFADWNGTGANTIFVISLEVQEGRVVLKVENAYSEQHVLRNKGTGKGIQLVRQRLNTLYPGRYQLAIKDKLNFFKVNLSIDLKS